MATKLRDTVVPASEEGMREEATRRARKRRDFKSHAIAFVVVNLAIWVIWTVGGILDGGWDPWPVFVTLIWGAFLALEGLDVYFKRPISEADVEREIERMKTSR